MIRDARTAMNVFVHRFCLVFAVLFLFFCTDKIEIESTKKTRERNEMAGNFKMYFGHFAVDILLSMFNTFS